MQPQGWPLPPDLIAHASRPPKEGMSGSHSDAMAVSSSSMGGEASVRAALASRLKYVIGQSDSSRGLNGGSAPAEVEAETDVQAETHR